MKLGKEIIGICLKAYQHEDDVTDFEEGNLQKDEIRVFEVGKEYPIVDGLYNPEYWKPKS